MRTNLSCCLGLIDNGQYKSTNRLLVVVPHERPHGIMRLLKNLCMLLPKALKMRAIKDTMALVADSIGGTEGAPAQMSWHLRHLNPALLNRQGMSTHPKMENGSELCHWCGCWAAGVLQYAGLGIQSPVAPTSIINQAVLAPILIAGAPFVPRGTNAIGDERHCVFDCPHFQGLRQQRAGIFQDAMRSLMWHKDQKSVRALVLAIVNEAQTA